ncbi:MAG TPA: hypothetical protein P5137_03270 [Candidatus Brocadiia bacterium]|nr:hypothetical protein [Candidatus Brocadiia bacterium]
MRTALPLALALALPLAAMAGEAKPRRLTALEKAHIVIEETQPLKFPRGNRLPFIVWGLQNIQAQTDAELEDVLRKLADRGIATVWGWNVRDKEKSLAAFLKAAALHKKLGLPVVVNSTSVMHQFFNGDEQTAHVDAKGEKFFDTSFGGRVKLGCPFSVTYRFMAIREQVEFFVQACKENAAPLDIVIADWELDGPIEWNDAWNQAKRCARCRKNIPNIENFAAFQAACRKVRHDMQRECYARVVLAHYPKALVGNYAEYPNNGWRYWYDYFEEDAKPPVPVQLDHRAPYRPWTRDFAATEYTFAMPVVYTWYRTFNWYDFKSDDYRWFYNMLLVATNAGQNAPAGLPVITFVHWHTTAPPKDAAPVPQLSEAKYQDLLWHMLLRGHDGLAMWCMPEETAKETRLVQEVYAASLEFKDFLDLGKPICWDVPKTPGPVVSALSLDGRLLVRRTDFDDNTAPVVIQAGGRTVRIPRADGKTQVIALPQ